MSTDQTARNSTQIETSQNDKVVPRDFDAGVAEAMTREDLKADAGTRDAANSDADSGTRDSSGSDSDILSCTGSDCPTGPDDCPLDDTKTSPGVCGCGVPDSDWDGDGISDCVDSCDGINDAQYAPTTNCGVGFCRTNNRPSSCTAGVETACKPANPLGATDSTCDGVDDDCDGLIDEDYVPLLTNCGIGACAETGTLDCIAGVKVDSCSPSAPLSTLDITCDNVDDDCDGSKDEDYLTIPTNCGKGVCSETGVLSCAAGAEVDSCVPGLPLSVLDDASGPGNGLDDNCDGQVDEDIACDPTPQLFTAGLYANLAVPLNCGTVSVKLWGGAGAAGEFEGLSTPGGPGGSGGYAESTLVIAGTLDLRVAGGGAEACAAGGISSIGFRGGSGGSEAGANGEDGALTGGLGGTPSNGSSGGMGSFGGGGGGEGDALLLGAGKAGGGGGASVLLVDSVSTLVAGGGGGGGGAATILILTSVRGGYGGGGCSVSGETPPDSRGGGGGGGGVCIGDTTQAGSTGDPHLKELLPVGVAHGGTSDCEAGGDGYAIVTFSE